MRSCGISARFRRSRPNLINSRVGVVEYPCRRPATGCQILARPGTRVNPSSSEVDLIALYSRSLAYSTPGSGASTVNIIMTSSKVPTGNTVVDGSVNPYPATVTWIRYQPNGRYASG